ncbi:MAG: hypothetical protein EXS64_06595 [Candidatus Latescibacteria bacterium]|nr:hypothetical protein [Candidatus Latescibacterota bacterium]
MFNTILTTTLEAVILLDILGVVVYFVISGIVRARKQPSVRPSVIPAGPVGYAAFSPSLPYASPASPAPAASHRGWPALRGLKDRMARRHESEAPVPETAGIEVQQHKIGLILDSFKEDV